jgi:nucleoporin GLE1
MLVNDDRAFRTSLDEQTAAQHKLHVAALDRALAKHEEVRESAERARERVELELERDRRRREEEEKRAVERARRELEQQKVEEQKRQLEEQNAVEESRRKLEELRRQQDEAKRRADAQKQQQEEERARKEREAKEEADGKARQEAEARERAQQAEKERQKSSQQTVAPPVQTNGVAPARPTLPAAQPPTSSSSVAPTSVPQGLVSSMNEREAVHKNYLDLHQRLKQMRAHVSEEVKRAPGLKNQLSDWRRTIHKCCGQLSKLATAEAKDTNKRVVSTDILYSDEYQFNNTEQIQEIVQQLDAAAQVSEPSVDITHYLVQNEQPPGANPQGPAVLLFLLNHLSKNVINQFMTESAVDSKSADSIGVLAVTIFARPQYLFNGQSLMDIFWAKYHKHCPVLFGISGSEKTGNGRLRLGWQRDGPNGFVTEQEHYQRMAGLGAGFAAITLRDFSKSKNKNPAPNRIYWQSLARIVDTPTQEVQPTHFVLIKAMINNYVPRIISTFGGAGIAALRQALIFFPNEKGPQGESGNKITAVTAVQSMPVVLQRELHLTL